MISASISKFRFMDFSKNQIPATFGALINSSCPLFSFLRGISPVTGLVSTVAILFVTVLISGFLYFKKKKNKNNVSAESMEASMFDPLVMNELVGGRIGEIGIHPDAEYAEALQLQEALVASLYTGPSSMHASPSIHRGPFWETEFSKLENEGENQVKSLCEICLDDKESWQMFKNNSCSHSFCYECTSKHIVTRITQKANMVGCPGVGCSAALDVNACRFMIPEEAIIWWDESLCHSMILDCQKLYCPFRDCSALLVNDSGVSIERINCPLCKRSFCVACRVPWHTEFTCKEFQKLNAKKGGKEEGMVSFLAKKKKWQKCPNCEIFVEKTEGCIHMTCRCKYEFCYRCGVKWTGSHVCSKK